MVSVPSVKEWRCGLSQQSLPDDWEGMSSWQGWLRASEAMSPRLWVNKMRPHTASACLEYHEVH